MKPRRRRIKLYTNEKGLLPKYANGFWSAEFIPQLRASGHGEFVSSVAFSPDGHSGVGQWRRFDSLMAGC
jgi:hypothetical protein